jgi:hypothetical protein
VISRYPFVTNKALLRVYADVPQCACDICSRLFFEVSSIMSNVEFEDLNTKQS